MSVSEQRVRQYRQIRRQGHSARTAAWLTSAPRYDVPSAGVAEMPSYDPHVWRAHHLDPEPIRPWSAFEVATVEVSGSTYIVGYVPDDEPYEWGDMEPTDEDRENVEAWGVVVVRVSDGKECALWGCDFDDRLSSGADDRYLREVACDLIDEISAVPVLSVAPLLLPMGVTA